MLTDTAIRNGKLPTTPKKLSDGKGLYRNGLSIEIAPSGGKLKLWRWKYRYMGKEKRLALGHILMSVLPQRVVHIPSQEPIE